MAAKRAMRKAKKGTKSSAKKRAGKLATQTARAPTRKIARKQVQKTAAKQAAKPGATKAVKKPGTRSAARSAPAAAPRSASDLTTALVRELGDWRGEKLARVRELVREADPEIVEEWKWSTPVWSHDGIVCTAEIYKQVVKLTFPQGAALDDPGRLFNAGFNGRVRRAIDIREQDAIDPTAFIALVREAVAFNQRGRRNSTAPS